MTATVQVLDLHHVLVATTAPDHTYLVHTDDVGFPVHHGHPVESDVFLAALVHNTSPLLKLRGAS